MSETLLDTKGVAKECKCSERHVQRIPEDVLPRVRIGRLVRYRKRDVERLIETCATRKAA